jgi:hypothetical protein
MSEKPIIIACSENDFRCITLNSRKKHNLEKSGYVLEMVRIIAL